jgi:hypothetical protein
LSSGVQTGCPIFRNELASLHKIFLHGLILTVGQRTRVLIVGNEG